MDMEEPTMELAEQLINGYCSNLVHYIDTGKKKGNDPKEYMNCYNAVVKLSDEYALSENLFMLYKQKIGEMLTRIEAKIQVNISDSKEFLSEYLQQWRAYTLFVYSLNKVMFYLDRFHLKNQGDKSLTATSLNMFRDCIFKKHLQTLRGSTLNEIRKDREGEMVDHVLIKNSIQQFIYMGYEEKVAINKRGGAAEFSWVGDRNLMVYDKQFEHHLKIATEDFYRSSSEKWRVTLSCYEYVLKVHKHLTKEENNADQFLQEQTKPQIIKIVLHEAVEKYAEQITELNMGCSAMFDDRKGSELKLIYEVFIRVDETLKYIIQKMDPFIIKEGEKIVLSSELQKKPLELVRQMLALKTEIDEMIADSFQNDMRFQKARDQAFQAFMNKFKLTPAFIALYMDHSQKDTFRQMSMPDIEKQIDQVIKLFCCLNGRDEFIIAYSLLLADRLLNKLSLNDEAEESVIKQLQVECGHNIVSKIKTMFSDINKSKDLVSDFVKHNGKSNIVQQIEFNVQVLTSGHWPFQTKKKLTVPSQMRNTQMVFSQFYQKKFSNRQLLWLYDKGSMTLQTTYLDRPYQLEVNTVQACILMLFNEQDRITCEEVIQKLGIDLPTFKAAVKTNLCRPKLGVIQNQSGKPSFDNPKEELFVNMAYKDKMIKKNFAPKQTAEQMVNQKEGGIVKQVDESVEVARQHIIDSVAVRNMKARKVETLTRLMEAIISQITMFTADPRMIKRRVENLMERGFMKRDEEDNKKLIYIP